MSRFGHTFDEEIKVYKPNYKRLIKAWLRSPKAAVIREAALVIVGFLIVVLLFSL